MIRGGATLINEPILKGEWNQPASLSRKTFTCGYCAGHIGHREGYFFKHINHGSTYANIRICSSCHRPTYFEGEKQVPGPLAERTVEHLPSDVATLYEEARRDCAEGCFTSAVLILRKILMHLAVNKEAKPGLKFEQYVDYLGVNGFVPLDGKPWVDRIRNKGNGANHEIVAVNPQDADDVLTFTEMLLRFVYEMPGRLKVAMTR